MVGREARLAPVILVLVSFLTACSSSDSRRAPEGGSVDPSEDGLSAAPTVGTCWAIPADQVFDQSRQHDDSPVVTCDRRHDAETVAVWQDLPPTYSQVVATYDQLCRQTAKDYVGRNDTHWVPLDIRLFVPDRDQQQHGSAYTRCDVISPADLTFARPRWLTSSVRHAVPQHDTALWACTDQTPSIVHPVPFVPCDRPHRFEATGRLLVEQTTKMPTRRRLATVARRCGRGLPQAQLTPDSTIQAVWDGEVRNNLLVGLCWWSHADHTPLPPRG
jgi:putative regulator of septum formation